MLKITYWVGNKYMTSIFICVILSFLYSITRFFCIKLRVQKYHVYFWAFIVLYISLLYQSSYIWNNSFAFFHFGLLKDFLLIAVCAVGFARFSGYRMNDKKQIIDFIAIFPIFEELLFRGTILPILLQIDFVTVNLAVTICSVLFGIMHIQYFGFSRSTTKKVMIAAIGGYFFSKITYTTGSIIPSIVFHMIFNSSAVLFFKNSAKKQGSP